MSQFASNEQLLLSKLNQKCDFQGTGNEIAALTATDIGPGTIAFCTKTEGIFLAGVYYGRNAADNNWIAIAGIFRKYVEENALSMFIDTHPMTGHTIYRPNTGSGGSINTDSGAGGVNTMTGTTINGYGNVDRDSLILSWASTIKLVAKVDHDGNFTQETIRLGIDCEAIQNALTTGKQILIENDPGATAVNWNLITSDGTTRTSQATAQALSGSVRRFRLEYVPNVSVKFYSGGTLDTTKTTNLPNTGNSGRKHFSAGIKTKDTSGKTWRIMGWDLIAKKGESH